MGVAENVRAGLDRRVPLPGEIARRRRVLRWTKWVLPSAAVLLLVSIAAWPEFDRSMNAIRNDAREAAQVRMDAGRMLNASYRGLDSHGSPYMITADQALQRSGPPSAGKPGTTDRIDLTRPIGDTLTGGGDWLRVSADDGVYMQHEQALDLSHNVLLYRADGIMMTSPTADMDLKHGVIASNDWVHAEGPFGVLDAQSYFLSQNEGLGQFRGPGRLVLNDDKIAKPPAPAAAAPAAATPAAATRDTGAVR